MTRNIIIVQNHMDPREVHNGNLFVVVDNLSKIMVHRGIFDFEWYILFSISIPYNCQLVITTTILKIILSFN